MILKARVVNIVFTGDKYYDNPGADVGSTGCKCAAYSKTAIYCGSYREVPDPAGVLRIDAEKNWRFSQRFQKPCRRTQL